MALEIERKTLEAEKLVGARNAQVMVRAETLVPGAGRDAIEALLADARLFIDSADIQRERVVIEGTVRCQAVYRQGEETALRALTAQANLSHVLEIPDSEPGMLVRARGEAVHAEARYENGHIVFQVACDLSAQVLELEPVELITAVKGQEGLQERYSSVCSVKLAAEASETALLTESVSLPAALDARATLMDWATPQVEEVSPDLGGIRVKGRVFIETLVASGAAGRPGVVVRYPVALDQLVELPDWLTGNVYPSVDIRDVRSRVEPGDEEGEMKLACEIEARVRVLANVTDCADALVDIYATRGAALDVEREDVELCSAAKRATLSEVVRGTVLIGENAPGVGAVIAVQVHPSVGERRVENGQERIDGVMELSVLYMPGGSELPASTEAELPFSIASPVPLNDESWLDIQVVSAEANALMSDRLEVKLQLNVTGETRKRERIEVVEEVEPAEAAPRRPGIVVAWPEVGETAWTLGKRYGVPAESLGDVEAGKPVIVKV